MVPEARQTTKEKLLQQDYQQSGLKSYFYKFNGRYNDFVSKYNLPLARMLIEIFHIYC